MKKRTTVKPHHTYKTVINFTCPKRGPVSQEVEVKVYSGPEAYHSQYGSEEIEELLRQEGVSLFDDDLI